MKAAVYHGRRDVRVEDVEEPQVRPGTVKLRVEWCGICGTDLHEYTAGPVFIPADEPHPLTGETMPVIMGHELAGVVEAIGEGAQDVAPGLAEGDRVAVEPVLRCGECAQCVRGAYNRCRRIGFHGISGGGGGLAERTVVPAETVHRLPDGLDLDVAALVEPMAVSFHAVREALRAAGRPGPAVRALVLGAGPIGATTLACLRAAGARLVVVSEVSQARKELAARLGADVVLDPTEVDVAARVRELTGDLGADVAFDAAGVPQTWQQAMAATAEGGTVCSVAVWEQPVELQLNQIVLSEQRLLGTICYVGDDYAATMALMADGRLPTEALVTKRIALDDVVEQGFEELVAHRDRNVKILVRP